MTDTLAPGFHDERAKEKALAFLQARQAGAGGRGWRGQSLSMMVALAMPPPSHMVCRP
jgi:hypothetical protein